MNHHLFHAPLNVKTLSFGMPKHWLKKPVDFPLKVLNNGFPDPKN